MRYYLFKKVYNICLLGIDCKDNYYYKRHKNKLILNTLRNYKLLRSK